MYIYIYIYNDYSDNNNNNDDNDNTDNIDDNNDNNDDNDNTDNNDNNYNNFYDNKGCAWSKPDCFVFFTPRGAPPLRHGRAKKKEPRTKKN
jgi:hypothetical protein